MKLYRWLLYLYPASFREEYGSPMERQFRDDYRDAHGPVERFVLWVRAITDLLICAPRQLANELTLDLKHAGRLYRKHWVSTLLAVSALGLAIGLSTGVFCVLNALLFRGLPFRNPSQLVELISSPMTALKGHAAFKEWAHLNSYLQDAATFSVSEMNLEHGRDGYRVKAAETSSNFFALLGAQAAIGRTFAPNEDSSGNDAVAVIGHGLWQQLFAGSRNVVGMPLHVNGAIFTIIGVAPAAFDYPGKANIWVPTVFDFEKVPKRGAFLFQTIGRLKTGLTVPAANPFFLAEVQRANVLTKSGGLKSAVAFDDLTRPRLTSLQNQLAGPVRSASWVLAGLCLLVLLIACANVAQLLLSRTTDRREELELRSALGASRARLLQQLITEALSLTVAAAVTGLFVARWTAKIASSFAPAQLATQQYTLLDWRVVAFAVVVAVVTAIAFGTFPAALLRRFQRPFHINLARKALIAFETALALCLVMSSLAMGRTFLKLLDVDLGFRTASVVTLNVSLQGTSHQGPGEWQYYREALDRLRYVPGVDTAGAVGHLPLANDLYMANSFKLDSGQEVARVMTNGVTPGYFRAMETSLLAGRDFPETPGSHVEPLVVVNEAFARATGLGTAIVGRKLISPWSRNPYTIIGVVSTVRVGGPSYAGGPQTYWQVQEEPPPALTLVARVQGSAEDYLARCRDAVRSVDTAVPVYDVKTLDERLAEALARPRFYTTATVFLGLLSLLLAAVASYGTSAYSIAQRTKEMGIRLAIGASYSKVRTMLFYEALAPILFGAVAGFVLSLASGRFLEHLLENASRPAVWACVGAVSVLVVAGAIAAWSAGRRILWIDPADTLRAQ